METSMPQGFTVGLGAMQDGTPACYSRFGVFLPKQCDRGCYRKCIAPVSTRGVAWACAASSLLFTVHSCLSKSSKCISTGQARKIWVVPCAFSDMVVAFRGRRKGNLVHVVQSRLS